MSEHDAISAFILAGGKSSRMGSDKAFLELAGKPLIAHAIELARTITTAVAIVGAQERLADYGRLVSDVYAERGPLGGIHAALSSSISEWNLILAVDLPFVEADFLQYLMSRAQTSGAIVTVPFARSFFHPLCGIYRKGFATLVEAALQAGRNKIDALFPDVPLCIISERDINSNGFSVDMFRNLNTPEEWEQAKRNFAGP